MSEQFDELKGRRLSSLDGVADEQQPFLPLSKPSTVVLPSAGRDGSLRRRAALLVSVAANFVLTVILLVTWITTRNRPRDPAIEPCKRIYECSSAN